MEPNKWKSPCGCFMLSLIDGCILALRDRTCNTPFTSGLGRHCCLLLDSIIPFRRYMVDKVGVVKIEILGWNDDCLLLLLHLAKPHWYSLQAPEFYALPPLISPSSHHFVDTLISVSNLRQSSMKAHADTVYGHRTVSGLMESLLYRSIYLFV